MAQPEEKRYTYGDLMEWEDGIRWELYDGVPQAMSAPTERHQTVCTELVRQFANYLLGKKCRVYTAPFDVRIFDAPTDRPEDSLTVVQPDLTVVCDREKLDRRGVKGAPSLAVEVLSPSTKQTDKLVKHRMYQQAGVPEYWIVDPETRTVQVYTLEEGAYHAAEVYTAEQTVPVTVLEGCAIDLSTVFPEEL